MAKRSPAFETEIQPKVIAAGNSAMRSRFPIVLHPWTNSPDIAAVLT
jgi:hypothetical protein